MIWGHREAQLLSILYGLWVSLLLRDGHLDINLKRAEQLGKDTGLVCADLVAYFPRTAHRLTTPVRAQGALGKMQSSICFKSLVTQTVPSSWAGPLRSSLVRGQGKEAVEGGKQTRFG